MDGVNENAEYLVHKCRKRAVLSKHLFEHRYTWRRRDERGEHKSTIDYMAEIEKGGVGC